MMDKINILFILSDSLAPHFISIYGDDEAKTPHLDALAQQGVVYEKAYCNSPLCAPSRASLVTGRYVSELGCFDNASEFSSEIPTIAHALGAAGYETVIIGKMHFVGHDQWHGFDQRIAHETDYTRGYDADYYKLAYDWKQPSGGNPVGHDWMSPSYVRSEKWNDYRHHFDQDEQIHHAALNYLAQKNSVSSPFFCCVSYHAPHNPFWIPDHFRDPFKNLKLPFLTIPDNVETYHGIMDRWLDDFHYLDENQDCLMEKDNQHWLYSTFYGMVYNLDQRVGELISTIEKRGLRETTAIVFASDHGDMMGHRGMIQKRYFYERSVRVPLIFSFPESWKQGARISTPVSLIDLFPTFTAICQTPLPEDLPGISLLPGLQTGSEPPARTIFCEYHGEGVHAPCFMAVHHNYKFIYVHEHEERLYDIKNDPNEFQNLVNDSRYSEIAAKLKRSLLQKFDPERIAESALRNQQNRRFIYKCTLLRTK